jgi:transcriptional regulator with XRE-family HTH domain
LAEHIGIDRSALVRIEGGQRQVSALELFRLSDVLGVPVAHFVTAPPVAIVSQRADLDEDATPVTRDRFRFDALLEAHARDAQFLLTNGYLQSGAIPPTTQVTDTAAAWELARFARASLEVPRGPLPSMVKVSEEFGLHLSVFDLPGDGASMRLDEGFGVAVLSGQSPAGRRRFTAAHELGHHLLGDEYQSDVGVAASRDERERLIDAFAGELLLPRDDLVDEWSSWGGEPRHKLIELAAKYRVSWSVVVNGSSRINAISDDEARTLVSHTPLRGDFLAICGAEPTADLTVGQTGPSWRRAVLAAYHDGVLTPARAIELLRGAIDESDLPNRETRPQP